MIELTRNHLGILRVLREHPDSTTGQMKRLTRAKLDRIPQYLDELRRAGLVSMRETNFGNGTRMRRWRAL